jgi:hypothetical protein
MPTTFNFYADANLSSRVTNITELFPDTGSTVAQRRVWLGSRTTGRRLVAPDGTDTITVSLEGDAATRIRMGATAQTSLNATAGAPMELTPPIRAPRAFWLTLDATGQDIGSQAATLSLVAVEEQLQ